MASPRPAAARAYVLLLAAGLAWGASLAPISARAEVMRLDKELLYGLAALTDDDKETLLALRSGNPEVYIRNVVRMGRSVRIVIDTFPGMTAVVELTNNEIYSLPNFTPPDLGTEIARRSGGQIEVGEIRRTGARVEFDLAFVARKEEPPPPPKPEPAPVARPEPKPAPAPAPRPEPKPAPAPAPRPEPRPEPKPAPAPAPAPRPEPKPVPAPKPEPAPAPRQEKPPAGSPDTLTVARVSGSPPSIDGRGDDAAWKEARPLLTEIPGRRGTFLSGYAVTDGDMVYFLFTWNDPDEDTVNRPWIWDADSKTYRQGDALDDGIAVQFAMDNARKAGETRYDLWLWRAGREGRGEYATDATLVVSRKPLSASSYVQLEDGTGVWMRQAPDEGRLPYERQLPMEFRGDQLPGYVVRQPEGSAANVRARGAYLNGRWNVEFMRKLDTRHPDDLALVTGKTIPLQVSLYEKDEDNLGRFTGSLTLNWAEGSGRKGR
jgi:hypothetical protein